LKKKEIFVCIRKLYREFNCDISMYICIITWIGSSYFSPFYLSSLFMLISTGLKFYIHSCIESTSAIFTFLTPFFFWFLKFYHFYIYLHVYTLFLNSLLLAFLSYVTAP
jgi:hypothetical protein